MKTTTNRILSAVAPSLLALTFCLSTSWVAPPADAAIPVTLTLKGQWLRKANALSGDVAVQGQYAYVASGMLGLQVIDISDPANPRLAGEAEKGADGTAVAVSGNYVYVTGGGGLLILEQSRALGLEVSGRNPFTISLSGKPGTAVRLQRSSNLRDWEDWQSVTLPDAPLEFSDPDAAGATARFYRAVKP